MKILFNNILYDDGINSLLETKNNDQLALNIELTLNFCKFCL